MPYAELNGIKIHYEVRGSGPPLLMMAPGGFDSTIEKWTTSGIWVGVKPLETLTSRYTCIAYDRRESGLSGGKVERVSWTTYAHEAKALLDLLNFPRAFVMGGCMGCSTATAFAVTYPESTQGLVLHWPVGGVRWRQNGLERFQQHVNFLKENGLAAVVDLAREQGSFWVSPEAGPWASTIVADPDFAADFAGQDQDRYLAMVSLMGQMLFDRDTATGPEPQELMALKVPAVIIPGADAAHATSAARYLQECLDGSQYHDVPVEEQTPDRVRQWIIEFLESQATVAA
ncbi:MAG: alpha/beta hydrolase [Chloroflexi bacterium]|nr:alpha/beta hydrolase [Chloroflexota bacterium]